MWTDLVHLETFINFRNILTDPCTNTNTVQIQNAMMRNSENQNRNNKLKMLQKCTRAKEVDSEYQKAQNVLRKKNRESK